MEDITTSQENLSLTIETPLGQDVLLLDSLTGFEQISTPFEFHLKLHSTNASIDFSSLIGQEVTVTFSLNNAQRYFSGIVGEISQEQTAASTDPFTTHYQMKIYPSLWLLKFNTDYRIFQNVSTISIIKTIFTTNNLTNFTDKTQTKGQGLRKFCVQYGESAFDFVSRLMEQEGIFYFFEHTESEHQLVLADANSAFTQQPADSIGLVKAIGGAPSSNQILFCSPHQQVVPQSVTMIDYNFDVATTAMSTTASGNGTGGTIYRYPGLFDQQPDGNSYSTLRIQALDWNQTTLQGTSTAFQLTAGYTFTVTGHLLDSINKTYVAYSIKHTIGQNSCENSFIAFDSSIPFSPPLVTPSPRIYGTQTAVVTGKSGEEIWTDKYGRVSIKFYWDYSGTSDEKSSCMIRVAQTWAMSGWGTLFTPRVGQEVVVTFLEGDPDRPLITGCVYNCTNLPPYLPATPTKSTIKTNTSKGGNGSNEIRFEDAKGQEEIFINAQKDMKRVVQNNDTLTITQGSRTIMLSAASGQGDEKTATPSHSLTIVKGDDIIYLQQGNLSITLKEGDETHTLTQGNLSINLNQGNETHTITGDITLKATGDITIDAGGSLILKSGKDLSINAGTALSAQSGTGLTANAGSTLSLQSSAAASLQGTNVTITGSTGATMVSGPCQLILGASGTEVTSPSGLKITASTISLAGAVQLG